MLDMHDAGASLDYHGQEQLAQSCARQGGWRGKGQMRWRTVGRDIDGIESKIYISHVLKN